MDLRKDGILLPESYLRIPVVGFVSFSSLLYYAALKTGFIITERHHHSIDIYKEDERYIPLGADSTVVYGFRDLQFINPYNFPVQLKSKN